MQRRLKGFGPVGLHYVEIRESQFCSFMTYSNFVFQFSFNVCILCYSLSGSQKYFNSFTSLLLTLQDFLGQAHCTLGEVVGSLGSRLEKALG